MEIEEGLGKAIAGLEFKVIKVEGNIVTTDSAPKEFDRTTWAPFDYKAGQRYFRDIWENGEFVTSQETRETYLVTGCGGAPTKVEGSLEDFIERVQADGKRNKFKRLLGEGKIVAYVRAHAFDGISALLEVVLVEDSEMRPNISNAFEAYSMRFDARDGSGLIVEATYKHGVFDENLAHFRAAKLVQLPKAVIEIANPTQILDSDTFKRLDAESMAFVRSNSYRAQKV